MQIHEDYVAFSGDGSRAFEIALQTLLPLGFRIESQGSSRLVVTGPRYNSTRQNSLLGISKAEFTAERSSLRVRAELGGVDRMQRFLLFLLLGLGLFDSVLFTALWLFVEEIHAYTWFLAVPVLTFIPWIFVAPLMVRWISRRTKEALSALLNNMAMTG